MLLVKPPVPEPSVVFESAVVGFCDVLQQIPRAVTEAPPLFVTVPPPEAELCVIDVTEAVVTVGATELVVKDNWLPYAVPAELTAYALT